MTRCLALLTALLLCAGCDSESTETDEQEQSNSGGGGGGGLIGGGLLPSNDMLDNVSGGGTIGGGNNPVAQNAPPVNNPQPGDTPPPADIVDKQAAMAANPNLVEVTNDVNAGDYLTAVTDAYFSAASRVRVLAMMHNLDIQYAATGEYPSYEDFKAQLEQAGGQLNGLRANQVYAYDQTTGKICILEDQSAN
jgi:hypothetical protein